jgi:hypothetical protein
VENQCRGINSDLIQADLTQISRIVLLADMTGPESIASFVSQASAKIMFSAEHKWHMMYQSSLCRQRCHRRKPYHK